jgi:hypothetical protein
MSGGGGGPKTSGGWLEVAKEERAKMKSGGGTWREWWRLMGEERMVDSGLDRAGCMVEVG